MRVLELTPRQPEHTTSNQSVMILRASGVIATKAPMKIENRGVCAVKSRPLVGCIWTQMSNLSRAFWTKGWFLGRLGRRIVSAKTRSKSLLTVVEGDKNAGHTEKRGIVNRSAPQQRMFQQSTPSLGNLSSPSHPHPFSRGMILVARRTSYALH
jgi:hypothetical protein